MTPVEVAESLIGPPPVIGGIVGYDRTAAYLWRTGNTHRDAGDIPSARNMRLLLAHAAKKKIPLTADHLIWGAPRTEIDALLAAMPARNLPPEHGTDDIGPPAIQAAE